MKRIILESVALLTSVVCFSQHPGKIKYIFPDAVETKIDSCLGSLEQADRHFHFYLLLTTDSAKYDLTISRYTEEESKNISPWVKETNRWAVINKRLIPLIFDYDMKFSTHYPDRIGSFGNRDGEVIRSRIIIEGTTISFDRYGNIVKQVNW